MIKEASEYKALLDENLIIDDWQAIDIILAVVASHKIPGNMLWLRVIGASGSGKTEILRTLLSNNVYCAKGESFTPGAIRRGYKTKGIHTAQTMLERWNGKLVVTKEFNNMLTKNRELQIEVFGLLRSVHDGELVADYGSEEGYIEQKTRFDWILGVTSYVDRQSALEQQLGSRFIDLRWGKPFDIKSLVSKALDNDEVLEKIQNKLAESMAVVISKVTLNGTKPDISIDWLADISQVVAICRTNVVRDGRSRAVTDIPETEAPTRIAQGFARIIKGLHMLGINEYKPYIIRLMFDNMLTTRRRVIKAQLEGHETQRDIAEAIGISPASVNMIIEDLNILGFEYDKVKEIINEGE